MKKSSSVILNKLVESLYYRIEHVNVNSPVIGDFENLEDAIHHVSLDPELLANF